MQTDMRTAYIQSIRSRLSEHRFLHSMGVEKAALQLAEHYGVDKDKASCAALLHDYAKQLPKQQLMALAIQYGIEVDPIYRECPGLLHGPVAAELVKEDFGIRDPEILRAIACHTVGAPCMSPLEKIIYLADMIEENRDFSGINIIRKAAFTSLDEGMLKALEQTVGYTMQQRLKVHPDSILAYNSLLNAEKENENENI